MIFFSKGLYKVFIEIYYLGVWVSAKWLKKKKAIAFLNGRKDVFKRLKTVFEKNKKPVLWFHCASLGEFEQGRPVIESLRKEYSERFFFLTFFSPSGYEKCKNYSQVDYVEYLPKDTRANASNLVQLINPALVIFVKYEFWYFLIKGLKKKSIPIILISAKFNQNQIFFKWYGGLFRDMLKVYWKVFVQDELSKTNLEKIKVGNSQIAGDTRFDRVVELANQDFSDAIIESFKEDSLVLLCGSTWQEDIRVLSKSKIDLKIKLIIAPHEISSKNIEEIFNHFPARSIKKYSEIDSVDEVKTINLLIIDSIGMLSKIYRYCNISYVGGAFGAGLHNILEPATYGKPIIFGQKFERFKEARDLVDLGGAFSVKDEVLLLEKIEKLTADVNYLKSVGAICSAYVKDNVGATQKITDYIKENMEFMG